MNQGIAEKLKQELALRQKRNASYSLRAFSRDLGISPTILSQFLNGKRSLSRKHLDGISRQISDRPLELGGTVKVTAKHLDNDLIKEDEFKLISDWYYFSIMNLAKMKSCKADPRWIGKSLNLDPKVVESAIELLTRHQYVKVHAGRLVRTRRPLRTTFDISSAAIRKSHKQNLARADKALDEVSTELREFVSLTADINSERLPLAKDLIRKFLNELCRSMQVGTSDEVYTFAVQLFPQTNLRQPSKGNEK